MSYLLRSKDWFDGIVNWSRKLPANQLFVHLPLIYQQFPTSDEDLGVE